MELTVRVHVPKYYMFWGPMYPYRDYSKANVYTILVHGPLGLLRRTVGKPNVNFYALLQAWPVVDVLDTTALWGR